MDESASDKYSFLNEEKSKEVLNIVKYAVEFGYKKAYNPSLDFLDLDIFEEILFSYPEAVITRSEDNLIYSREEVLSFFQKDLSENAFILLEKLLLPERLSLTEANAIREKANAIDPEEKQLIIFILDNSIAYYQEIVNSIFYDSDSATTRSSSFGCNFAAGASASALGYVIGAVIGGPAGTFIGLAIDLIGGAFISSERC